MKLFIVQLLRRGSQSAADSSACTAVTESGPQHTQAVWYQSRITATTQRLCCVVIHEYT